MKLKSFIYLLASALIIIGCEDNISDYEKNDTVYDALVRMAQKDIGALLVEDNDKLIGIFSERDYARKVVLEGKTSKESTVGEMMSTELTVVGPDNTMRECMALMTQKKIRHIPVVEDDFEERGNPDQEKISLQFEKREKPHLQALGELMEDEFEFRYRDAE